MSLEVNQGETVCLLGSNAAGKSTTLRTILGMVRPIAGEMLEGNPSTVSPPPRSSPRGSPWFPRIAGCSPR